MDPSEPLQMEGVNILQPVDPTNQQTYALLLADAVRAFTAAARLGRSVSGGAGDERGEPVDWAEFVTLTLAGAAANVGHVEAVLAGRPGSWEAEGVRQLLISTIDD